jgi:hypothetical protein
MLGALSLYGVRGCDYLWRDMNKKLSESSMNLTAIAEWPYNGSNETTARDDTELFYFEKLKKYKTAISLEVMNIWKN